MLLGGEVAERASGHGSELPNGDRRWVELPNAVWRFESMIAAHARCLVLAFRYTALSDEKREGIVWVGLNLASAR